MKLLEIPALCEWTLRRTYGPGQTIFLEGDAPNTVYQVVSGVVKLTRCSSQGREMIVALAFPGQFIDVVACLDGQFHGVSASSLAGSPAVVAAIPRDRALAHTGLVRHMERAALEELRAQRDWTVSLALERVESRMIAILKMLANGLGEIRAESYRLPVILTRQELAELVGATTETTIRALSQFRRQGVMQEKNGWMTLAASVCAVAA
ncbi:MAG: Crp/Fnr family transcriptional regulator [Candidatus Eremiobacterota bacterium]